MNHLLHQPGSPQQSPLKQGSLKDTFCNHLKHGFCQQNRGKPQFTSCNVQVCNVRIAYLPGWSWGPLADLVHKFGMPLRGTTMSCRALWDISFPVATGLLPFLPLFWGRVPFKLNRPKTVDAGFLFFFWKSTGQRFCGGP